MKHVIVMALGAALALASCVSKGTVVKVEEQRDSLSVVVSAKDSLISAVFEDISSISENLALIRTRENLLSVAGDAEGGRRPVEEINNDIAAIDRLLRENKVKIASLQSAVAQLRKANLRLDGLEKMIRDMSAQLAEKKNEIARLRDTRAKAASTRISSAAAVPLSTPSSPMSPPTSRSSWQGSPRRCSTGP